MAWITFSATVVSLLVYLVVGLSSRSAVKNEYEYFLAGRTVGANDYANTSVGYALQMAALFLFATWGFLYGVGALWTAVFWALGYLLLYLILPQFSEFRAAASKETLHSFIRKRFSSSKSLQIAAAIATMIGLMGVMLAEVDYTVAVYKPVLTVRPIFVQVGFLALGVGYVVWNGFRAEVNTERVQVPLAYIGLLIVLLAMLPQVYIHSGMPSFRTIAVVTALALAVMLLGKVIDVVADSARSYLKWFDWQAAIPAVGLVVLIAEVVWVPARFSAGSAPSVLDQPLGTQLLAQGVVGLVSLLIANALWMPVDISTWQRIGSVSGSDAVALTSLRRGTFRVMLESPAGWCLGAVLGWAISAGGFVPANTDDPYSVVASFAGTLTSGTSIEFLGAASAYLYPVFVVACVAVMTSTITSILSAVSLTVDKDILPDRKDNLKRVRLLTFGIVVIGFLIYEGLRAIFQANLATLLYGAYSAQLSLFVVTLFALYQRRLSARAALWSVALGLVAAAISTILAIVHSERPELAVLPPLFAVLVSLLGYVIQYQLVERAEPEGV